MKVLIVLLCLICAALAEPVSAQQLARAQPAERRVALVIGNNDYVGATPLERAVADAQAIGAELRQVGFEVMEHSNLDRRGMIRAISELADKAAGGGVAVLFFAGHGVQVSGAGTANYLIPTDFKGSHTEDLADEAIDLARVMDRLASAKAKFSLLIIDACRDNPLPRVAGRSIGLPRGLSIPAAPAGLMVVYSAGVNEQALDKLDAKDRDPNGLFTREFVKQIRQPGVRVDEMVRRVRLSVSEQAQRVGHSQNPAIYDQARGDFYFVSAVATPMAAVPAAAPAVALIAQASSKSEEAAYELAFWDAIKSTQIASDFEEYLRQFPTGRFAGLAASRRDRLLASGALPVENRPAQLAGSGAGAAAPAEAPPRLPPLTSAPPPSTVQSAPPAIALAVSQTTVQAPAIPVQAPAASAVQGQAAASQVVLVTPLASVAPPAPVAPVASVDSRPTSSPELKSPTSLAAVRGKRYFGRSAGHELEVEVVEDGLRVIRFGTVDGKVLYRCGLFRNEIAVSRDLMIPRQVCGSTTGSSFPRKLSGLFPSINVDQDSGSTVNPVVESVLLVEQGFRSQFDDMLKATPGLTSEQFARGR